MIINIVNIKKWKSGLLFRFIMYGSLLVFGEIVFYNITKLGRTLPKPINVFFEYKWLVDPALNLNQVWHVPVETFYGQASLWMFLVYGSIALFGIENAYRKIKNWHWVFRGSIYMLIILIMECIWGWVLKWITGYDIWYYSDMFSIFKYTSLAIAPIWFAFSLISENLIKLVNRFEEVRSFEEKNFKQETKHVSKRNIYTT